MGEAAGTTMMDAISMDRSKMSIVGLLEIHFEGPFLMQVIEKE
jgi:hypothetical protein